VKDFTRFPGRLGFRWGGAFVPSGPPLVARWPLVRKASESAVRRLSLYLRALEEIGEEGGQTVSSRALAERAGTTAVQVRKDLSLFGSFGKRGLGYAVRPLRDHLTDILGLSRRWRVALIGAGRIGTALVEYSSFRERGFEIVTILDSDPAKIGRSWSGVTIQSAQGAVEALRRSQVEMAILAVPAESAQEAADALVAAGVRGILNLAPVRLKVPDNVTVNDVDMAVELESLSFALKGGTG
jgi:redox-sensing transcriptional repressor